MPRKKSDAGPAEGRELRTGRLARGAITGLAVVRAGVSHLGHRARRKKTGAADTLPQAAQAAALAEQARHEAELGGILFQALNQLKGTALKASQLLSMEAGLLPEGVRAALARGCHQATPLNRALVHKVFAQEFRQGADTLFESFDSQAFAAASLGQVHHAVLPGGEPVVVKVQYPGIAASIGSDMRMVRGLLQGLRLGTDLLPSRAIVERVLASIEHTLAEEVDYTHEAGQLRWFGEHARLPGLSIAQPVASHSTRRVLTMQRASGLHLDAWLATRPSQQARNRAGQLLFDWFMHSVFQWGRLHADPHPGNFLFRPDGRVDAIDFGCTRAMPAPFAQAVQRAWGSLLRPGTAVATSSRQACDALGLVSPSLSAQDFVHSLLPALAPMQSWQVAPFRQPHFDFATRAPHPVLARGQHQAMARHITGLREELPYFERAYHGLNHLLKALGAEVRTDNRWIHPHHEGDAP